MSTTVEETPTATVITYKDVSTLSGNFEIVPGSEPRDVDVKIGGTIVTATEVRLRLS